ncbi:MAG: 16S rRNA (uracil(1498)-N(3))-methyltransferase [Chitinophagaceae bacterium]|nr:16S rRNA (uracil(1498)-N(3))-methyltransferase [Oligoflexus sp.]
MKHHFRFHGRRSEGSAWEIMDEEWHHILKVLRLQVSDRIELSDGLGWVAQASLTELSKHKGAFSVLSEKFSPKPPNENQLTLGLGVLKPQGIDEVLPGLVELGVARLILIPFLGMDRARISEKLIERWSRQIVSASKQAKAAWFPELIIAESFDAFLDSASEFPVRYLLDPDGEAFALGVADQPILAVVGSEGGWHESEVKKFEDSGFRKLRLKSNILRATTAVLASAAILRQGLREG